jgi:FAD:protein FMN transferase
MKLTRRHAVLGLFAATPLAFTRSEAATVSRAGTAFGTTVRITVTADSNAQANAAIDTGFAEIRAVGKTFNLFDPASEASQLNAHGILYKPSAMMRELVSMTDVIWAETDGAFDPTVQPLWEFWTKSNGKTPSEDQLEDLRHRLGWQHVTRDQAAIRLTRPNMRLTFNGIAQGYAADRVSAALRSHGVTAGLIDTGEIGVLPPWQQSGFAIRDPRDAEKTLASIDVSEGFIATSGDYATHFTPDFSAHHIFDPKTAKSPLELSSATVVAPSGAQADAYATAMMVIGTQKSLKLAKRVGLQAWVVTKHQEIFQVT